MKIISGRLCSLMILGLLLVIIASSCTYNVGQEDNNLDPIITTDTPINSDIGGAFQTGQIPSGAPLEIENLPLDIEVASLLGGSETRFEPFYGLLPELAWSPDGRYLAIFAEKNGYGIWLWDRNIGQTRRLVQMVDRSGLRLTSLIFFGWSKDGRSLLYAVDGVQSETEILGENGVLVRQVDMEGTDQPLAWLPGEGLFIRTWLLNQDNHQLIFHRGRSLWTVNTVTGKSELIKNDLPTWDGLFWVAISPTAENVVYPSAEPGDHQLVILDVASGKETLFGDGQGYNFHPSWSPDGKRIAFLNATVVGQTYDFQIGEDGPLPPATNICVVTKDGKPVVKHTPSNLEKAGGPVWSSDSRRIAFLCAQVDLGDRDFPEILWRRLLVLTPGTNQLEELGQLSGDWITVGGFTPDDNAVYLYSYETGGGVTIGLYSRTGEAIMLAHGAVDEPAIWWDGKFVFPRLEGNHDDYLDTQLYAHNMKDQTYQLTDAPGWKSGAQITDGYLAYVCADNRSYPYPLTVVVQQLKKLAGNDLL